MSASQFTLDLTNDGFDDDNHNHNHNYNGTQSIRDFSEPMEQPQTQNVVATMNVSCRLDLKDIVTRSRNSEYNPKRFAAVVMRIREPKSTALIFQTGKIVITGARSENNAWIAARKYARILQKLDFPAQFRDFKIQNIVGSCDLGFPIRLEGLANQHSQFSSYEPELFPGLIYRMNQPKIVILSFVSGKIVLTGAKSNKQIINAFNKIYPILVQFRKDPNNHNHNDDDDVDVDVDMYDDE